MSWSAVAVLVSCGGSTAQAGGPPASDVRVGLVEWQITSSAGALARGPVTLHVTNAGTTAHDLHVRGDRVDVQSARLAPGQSTTLRLDLTGEHRVELWCTVPGHRAEGMHRSMRVGT